MQKEHGSATVVGFLLIFAILVSLAVLYFAAVVPVDEERAAETAVISAKEDMISFSLLLNELKTAPHVPVSYLPVFSESADAKLISGGSLSVGGEKFSLRKLVISLFSSEIGLSSGGICRSDDGNAVWLVSPEISGSGDCITCIIPLYHGSFSRGASSGGIPLTAEYLGTSVKTIHSDSPVTILYSGDDAKLWYAFFYELSKMNPQAKSPVFQGTAAEVTLYPNENLTTMIICPEYLIT